MRGHAETPLGDWQAFPNWVGSSLQVRKEPQARGGGHLVNNSVAHRMDQSDVVTLSYSLQLTWKVYLRQEKPPHGELRSFSGS